LDNQIVFRKTVEYLTSNNILCALKISSNFFIILKGIFWKMLARLLVAKKTARGDVENIGKTQSANLASGFKLVSVRKTVFYLTPDGY